MPNTYAGEEEILAALEILALSDDSMFVIDDQHRIVFWNRGAQSLLGYTHDEVAGRSCQAVLAGADDYGNRYCSRDCPVQMLARRGEMIRPFRLRYRARDGSTVPLDVTVVRFTLRVSKRTLLAHVLRSAFEPAAVAAAPPATTTHEHADVRMRDLTTREIEILRLLASGQRAETIAGALNISRLTTRNHIQHIFEKLEVHSRTEAVAFAYRMRLV